ncbi:uncharacterized protein LOC117173550 [Belonocnema kinseyi]|uniref:uncharacterized protein LOC117173550 n=1 Tax=Belonocnema kinseyi TaxID=2817044 RepID=UPI00143DB34F|nr:uncharacterized protein LOC117173550 [Belonocnema kinseyi]
MVVANGPVDSSALFLWNVLLLGKERLDKYYGNCTPSISMVKKWFTEFRCDCTSTSDAERSGRSKEVITPEIVDKIHGMMLDDRRVKVREVAEAVGISTDRVHHILHEYLNMKKLSAGWVPRLLTLDHKRNCVTTSKECLAMFNRNPNEFLRCFLTVDKTWIHRNTPETKEQSKQWVSSGECAPKKAKVGLSANKVMTTVFWDARCIIHIDYLQMGKIINGQYYSELLDRFDTDLKKKRPHLSKKKVLFHENNARVHTDKTCHSFVLNVVSNLGSLSVSRCFIPTKGAFGFDNGSLSSQMKDVKVTMGHGNQAT